MTLLSSLPPLEMWGGVECTINRVGNTYFDQLERNGHASRPDDIYRFADLGIQAIRYPIQWERIAPNGLAHANWSWADERLELLRSLGVTPIVGLTHHGSGPRSTSLVEASFAEGLAQFATAVAERYPWIEHYTPVNEPLTTARFSGLYGLWYPHGQDNMTFVRALLTQCQAVILSMQAIRRINPHAKLIQTEDLAKAFSTPHLEARANLENERRWLTFDLLCGRLDREKPMWEFMIASGAKETELEWFLEHPCAPDILGIDYYPTSERFLDENIERYPAAYHTVNGDQKYADVEAVRVNTGDKLPVGYYQRMRETWERYHIPLAITEVHLCSTREEQMRWLMDAWNAAQRLRQEGAEVRAITAWSLLGAYDWNCLVTRVNNFYEPGVFDVRGTQPRPTALARVVRALASNQQPDEPFLAQPGWWTRPDRFLYQSSLSDMKSHPEKAFTPSSEGRPLLIIGETGELATAFARLCAERSLPYRLVTSAEVNLYDTLSFRTALMAIQPWAVVFASDYGYMKETGYQTNSVMYTTPDWGAIADICMQQATIMMTFSSDQVFDGRQLTPYVESDPIAPCCQRGYVQAQMETQVLQHYPSALVIRTGALLSPWYSPNVVTERLRDMIAERAASNDDATLISLTYVPDLVHACLDLLVDRERGYWHLANVGARTWIELVDEVANRANLKVAHATHAARTQGKRRSLPHPLSYALKSERGQLLPSLDDALQRYQLEHTA